MKKSTSKSKLSGNESSLPKKQTEDQQQIPGKSSPAPSSKESKEPPKKKTAGILLSSAAAFRKTDPIQNVSAPELLSEEDKEEITKHYDSSVVSIISSIPLLSGLLHFLFAELHNISTSEIRQALLDEQIRVRSEVVDDLGTPDILIGIDTADKSLTEGNIFYDVLFDMKVPGSKTGVRLKVDIDLQRDLSNMKNQFARQEYYASRMISRQKRRIFNGTDYQKMHKSYSVWIWTDPPKKYRNFVNLYETQEIQIYSKVSFPKDYYDWHRIYVIGLDPEYSGGSQNPALEYLNTIFSAVLNPQQKKDALEKNFGITLEPKQRKDLEQMESARLPLENYFTEKATRKVTKEVTEKVTKKVTEKALMRMFGRQKELGKSYSEAWEVIAPYDIFDENELQDVDFAAIEKLFQ